ncbi:hypothetical protein FOZ63_027228, partial [Perkinsus olseni]
MTGNYSIARAFDMQLVQRRLTIEEFHLFVHQGVTGLCRLFSECCVRGDQRIPLCFLTLAAPVCSTPASMVASAALSMAARFLSVSLASFIDGAIAESACSSEGPVCFRVEDELRHVTKQQCGAPTDLALYVYPYFHDASQDFQRAFRREATLLREMNARLNVRLIKVFDFGESTANCAYQVRELLNGITLADYLSRKRASRAAAAFQPSVLRRRPIRPGLSEVQIVDLMISIISILEELENAIGARNDKARGRIIHSALDPRAVFLRDGRLEDVVLIRWKDARWDTEDVSVVHLQVLGNRCEILEGLPSRRSTALQKARAAGVENAGIMHLTRDVRYAHPDISRAEITGDAENEATRNWDMYSLGCIAFECVCLLPPFLGANENELPLDEPLAEHKGVSAGDDDEEEGPPLEQEGRAPYPWDHEEYGLQEIRERFDETAELQGLSEAYRKRVVVQHYQSKPADLRPVSAVSDELIDIIEMMLFKSPAPHSVDGSQYDHLDDELMEGAQNSEHTYADVIAQLRLLKEQLEQLPSALRDALSTWTAAVGEEVMVDPATSLDVRDIPMSPFSSRYLLKFATLLENSTARISGGELPLYALLQGMTTLDLNSKQLCSPD